ncbi:hypothetical protein PZ894_15085 [Nocardioides sp. YIM 152315]|nr:hypothetical protein [Nocardioides sp. YIM 152315]
MHRPLASGAVALALVLSGLGAVALGPPAAADDVVVERTADLTVRDGVGTGTGMGAQRLSSASVRADVSGARVQATVVLDAEPTAATGATVVVAFGPLVDGICQLDDFLDADQYESSTTDLAAGWTRTGRTLTLDLAAEEAGYQPWDCAGAILGVGGEVVSFLGGNLTAVHLEPQLGIDRPRILDKQVRGKLRLVRGQWHVVRVPVRGLNAAEARRVVVRGSGRGLAVTGQSLGTIDQDYVREAVIRVRAKSRKVGPLRLRVTSENGDTVRRKVPVRLVRAPARPVPGRYRSADGSVAFTITGGRTARVARFRVETRTRCQPPLDYATYTDNIYGFPKTRIGGGGVVDARQVKPLFSVSLQLKAVGRRVTQGSFGYVGPKGSYCSADERFRARRVRR